MSYLSRVPPAREVRLKLALALLRQGAEDAREFGESVWDFAVEIDRLHECGVTNNDLRRLVREGQIEHRLEIRSLRADARCFRSIANLCFTKRSCFILGTPHGASAAAFMKNGATHNHEMTVPPAEPVAVDLLRPCWDADLRQLRLGDWIVKEFRQPSARQVAVLSAFQAQGWPPRINDPLSATDVGNVQGLLHYTIQNLNRNQLWKLIHFFGDGTRRGVCWRLLTD